jgi:hypothetical protein
LFVDLPINFFMAYFSFEAGFLFGPLDLLGSASISFRVSSTLGEINRRRRGGFLSIGLDLPAPTARARRRP